MAKLTAKDFTARKGVEGGEFWESADGSWLSVLTNNGTITVEANSLDWFGEDGGTTVETRSGFATLDEALAWGAETISDVPSRLACAALETAFEAMAEWLPRVLPFAAATRAEAALAEREACVSALDAEIAALKALGYERDECGTSVVGWRIKSVRAARDAVRARTTPDTLSTDTLAAIAEARGLRLVEPEYLAELEGAAKTEREACAAEVSALLDQVQREIDTTYPTGRSLDELVAARTVLQKAAVMIGTRSIGGAR